MNRVTRAMERRIHELKKQNEEAFYKVMTRKQSTVERQLKQWIQTIKVEGKNRMPDAKHRTAGRGKQKGKSTVDRKPANDFGWVKNKDLGEGKRGDKIRLVEDQLRHPGKAILKWGAKAVRAV